LYDGCAEGWQGESGTKSSLCYLSFSLIFLKSDESSANCTGVDVVLPEIWRIKDELSTARGHDGHRLFAEARERQ
jgi:hypothetical protein